MARPTIPVTRSVLTDLELVERRSDLDARQRLREKARLKSAALVNAAPGGRLSLTVNGIAVTVTVSRIGDAVRCLVDAPVADPEFVFQNPPVLVTDPAGPIERQLAGADGDTVVERYREDHEEALRQILADALSRGL